MTANGFNFWCKIHRKPRGNWRPKLELSISISAEHYPHRPKFGLVLYGDYDKNTPFAWGKWTAESRWGGAIAIKLPGYLYKGPKRGKHDSFCGYRHDDDYMKGWYYTLRTENYLDEDISIILEAYLEWRPGAKPDYSDFAAAFRQIPDKIEEQLKDGLDSGQNDEVVITNESIKREKEKEQVKQAPTRKIRIS